ncbi:uncharacterized protein LOC130994324 [Salvia miltiorrhiza]|uniref:uncharacterized protein LOC130994324 n=1 Tax=Salvia miltiorrhiza TaxID=226208 RepID=UPI0025ABAFC3|nr:uncharacterized protein LOC130994324 [Salvia miltiorrhiza]
MKTEVTSAMKWIHIGAIQLVIKSSLSTGIDLPIDIAICDKMIITTSDTVLGAFSGNLYAKQIITELYPQIAYNLQDTNFSRALTLYQDYKRNDMLTEGNRPYSITYQVSYALSNSHHTDLFLWKNFIEIPEIFKEVAKQLEGAFNRAMPVSFRSKRGDDEGKLRRPQMKDQLRFRDVLLKCRAEGFSNLSEEETQILKVALISHKDIKEEE